jgi:tetrahydromethanopterin S-methyltransferase subunit C
MDRLEPKEGMPMELVMISIVATLAMLAIELTDLLAGERLVRQSLRKALSNGVIALTMAETKAANDHSAAPVDRAA